MAKLKRAPKAYHNLEFLDSPAARTVRILTEYFEPLNRLRKSNIQDTVVFFGSSRIKSKRETKKDLYSLKKKYANLRKNNSKAKEKYLKELNYVKKDLEMSKYYEETVDLAYLITKWSKGLNSKNKFVVSSGGGPGIMEAANRGAQKARGYSIGFNISLPFEQFPNNYISPNLNFEFHYFFMRKFWFAYLAKALVIMPGGYGTLDELMELLTLVQTNKLRKKMAIVVYGKDFWESIINFDKLVEYNMISKSDLKLFKFADTPEEAFEYLKKELSKYYIKG
jgi:uncharacterized protein (TIGR00730 family)